MIKCPRRIYFWIWRDKIGYLRSNVKALIWFNGQDQRMSGMTRLNYICHYLIPMKLWCGRRIAPIVNLTRLVTEPMAIQAGTKESNNYFGINLGTTFYRLFFVTQYFHFFIITVQSSISNGYQLQNQLLISLICSQTKLGCLDLKLLRKH